MVRPGHSPVLGPVWVAAVASSATRSPAPALCGRYPDLIALPLLGRLLPPACAGPGRTARPDAGDADVLVDPLAGADAVVAVGDDERMHAVGGGETQVYSMAETLQVHTGGHGHAARAGGVRVRARGCRRHPSRFSDRAPGRGPGQPRAIGVVDGARVAHPSLRRPLRQPMR